MLIDEDLLLSYGAQIETFKTGEDVFLEGDTPKCYYQIKKGRIKLNHYNEDGRELILAVLDKGHSVCELMLFIEKKYPMNAVALENTKILKLHKDIFIKMMDEHTNISRDINVYISERLYYKFIMLENNTSLHPHVRIRGVLDYHKSFSFTDEKYSYKVPLTRQELASFTGLRVETVIRTIKSLEAQQELKILNGKIFY